MDDDYDDVLLELVEAENEGLELTEMEDFEDDEKLKARPCGNIKCSAARCWRNCGNHLKCRCECKKRYGHGDPGRFTSLKCPGDSPGSSGGTPKPESKPCKSNRCKRANCKRNCSGKNRFKCS